MASKRTSAFLTEKGTSSFSPLYRTHKSGALLNAGEKQIVLNVAIKLEEMFPGKSWGAIDELASTLTGVSKTSIKKIKAEAKTGKLTTPSGKRPNAVGTRTRLRKYDEITLSAIKQKIHDVFLRNETPTVKKVCKEINEDERLPKMSLSTVQRLMKDLGFSYVKPQKSQASASNNTNNRVRQA